MSLTEDKIYQYIKQFGTLLESQLLEMMAPITEERLSRTLHKMWKKNMIKRGGPDNAYIMLNGGSDNVDMIYVDCIWILLAHATCEDDITTAYRGREFLKLSYFSREKQNSYNMFFVGSENDYPKVSFINNKYSNEVDEDMVETTRFIFISDSVDVLEKMPLNKFSFPYLSIQLDFTQNGRYKKPEIKIIE